MKKLENNFLYLVVLGGKAKKANIEVHDVRWVVGSKIEDTYDTLRKNWFGCSKGLHIDSYKKIKYIDGYKINLIKFEKGKIEKEQLVKNKSKPHLWFVNLGGYDPSSMLEIHEFGFVVAKDSLKAKKIAKSKWLFGYRKIHKDNLFALRIISDVDDCKVIKIIDNWEIELTIENDCDEDSNSPDWYGYKRIDLN